MQHHRRATVIASIAAMADDSDKNLAHNDEAQLQRLLDSMGQESAAAPRPPKKSSKGSAGQESAAPRPKKKKGAVSKFREQQKQKRRGSIDTGAAREPAPAPRKKKEKRRREAPQPQPRRHRRRSLLGGRRRGPRGCRRRRGRAPEETPKAARGGVPGGRVPRGRRRLRRLPRGGHARRGAPRRRARGGLRPGPGRPGEAADARRAARDAVKRLNRAKPGLEKRDAAALVDALGALDEAYHRLRYARRDAVPPPHQVFEKLLGRGSVVDEAADALMETLPADLRIGESDDPLHRLYRLRWREGAWLFGPAAPWRLDERLEPGEPTTTRNATTPSRADGAQVARQRADVGLPRVRLRRAL